MTRTNNTMTQSDNSINKITANTSNRGRGRGQHGSLGVCVCVSMCVCVWIIVFPTHVGVV